MSDPYQEVAEAMFNTKTITPDQRRLARSVVFATRYNNKDLAPPGSALHKGYAIHNSFFDNQVRELIERRRRARHQQRWAIALCVIGSALLLAWEAFSAH